MSTKDVAKEFTDLCKAGNFEAAGNKFWSEDVVSVEPMPGEMHRMQGRKALESKGKWWSDNNEVHGVKVEGPFVNGDQFTLRFEMDVTPKGKSRSKLVEVGLYTIKNGKIAEERFFFGG